MPVMSNIMVLNKKITDATAIPEDVLSGKVFYNNDGRQIGDSVVVLTQIINVEPATYTNAPSAGISNRYSSAFDTDSTPMKGGTYLNNNGTFDWLRVIQSQNIPLQIVKMMWFEYSVRGSVIPVVPFSFNRDFNSTGKYAVTVEAKPGGASSFGIFYHPAGKLWGVAAYGSDYTNRGKFTLTDSFSVKAYIYGE